MADQGRSPIFAAHFLLMVASLVLNVASGPQISMSRVIWWGTSSKKEKKIKNKVDDSSFLKCYEYE